MAKKATVDLSRCRGCFLCVRNCPQNAIRVVYGRPQVDDNKCIGCGICAGICPFGAIRIVERQGKETDKVKELKSEIKELKEVLSSILSKIDKLSNKDCNR